MITPGIRHTILLLLFAAGLSQAQVQEGPAINDQARFLAGLPVRGSTLEAYSRDPQWATHATEMDKAWGKTEERQLARVRSFSRAHVPYSGEAGTMYYMFSGPDFLYADAVFPNARTYILCGTEPVGQVPDLTKIPAQQLDASLQNLRLSMKTMLSFHYFITKDMRVDLTRDSLSGTLPILYTFLARTGHSIDSVTFVKSPAPGVRITFGGQTLYYFKVDLSNGAGSNGFLRWCSQQGPGLSLVKAASYLMHEESFSSVRNFLLKNSKVIVQDDSGIPLHHLRATGWDVDLYGHYTGVIPLFAGKGQQDLADAYAASRNTDLGFSFGYHWEPQKGMMMVARRSAKAAGSSATVEQNSIPRARLATER